MSSNQPVKIKNVSKLSHDGNLMASGKPVACIGCKDQDKLVGQNTRYKNGMAKTTHGHV